MADGAPFAFAGLWEHWERNGSVIESCTILTTDANELVSPIHNRMPVILDPADFDEWLSPKIQGGDKLRHLLRPFPAQGMKAYPVSTLVNNPRNEDPSCVVPLN
jgi:putative SOS response-associated peptidase YedK